MRKTNKPKDEKIKVINKFISAKEVKELDIDLKEVEIKINSSNESNGKKK